MKYFFDTEFSEVVGRNAHYRPTIDLISIGIVCADGREYYAEAEFAEHLCNPWVRSNVLPLLGPEDERKDPDEIREDILKFVGRDSNPEFWAYYADYDWVVFCWLFGAMIDLPEHFPMFCMDLQQWWVQLGKPDIKPEQPARAHNALEDALWNKKLWEALDSYHIAEQMQLALRARHHHSDVCPGDRGCICR